MESAIRRRRFARSDSALRVVDAAAIARVSSMTIGRLPRRVRFDVFSGSGTQLASKSVGGVALALVSGPLDRVGAAGVVVAASLREKLVDPLVRRLGCRYSSSSEGRLSPVGSVGSRRSESASLVASPSSNEIAGFVWNGNPDDGDTWQPPDPLPASVTLASTTASMERFGGDGGFLMP